MRWLLATPALALLFLLPGGAEGSKTQQVKKKRTALVMTFRFDQHTTRRQPHPPAGDVGDTFTAQLVLHNTDKPLLGRPARSRVGTTSFSYVWTKGSECSAIARGDCRGTIPIQTVTRLPGGTIRASAGKAPISAPFIVNVTGGTGRYAGARGRIFISDRNWNARIVFRLSLP